jgi:thymidylate synthase (FAD)
MMKASLIAWTSFDAEKAKRLTGWETDVANGEALVEFAGRACYQSWGKPNPETATNEGYIRNILKQQHWSVLEHGVATFYITGVSRSLTHELIRHRAFSVSELSQRYVDVGNLTRAVPPALANRPELLAKVDSLILNDILPVYGNIVAELLAAGLTRKEARQTARAVMPNATETRIVVTGNYRAWRHFIAMRATEHADAEIFNLAVEIFEQLDQDIPHVMQDAQRYKTPNGSGVRFPLTVV